MRVGVISDTHLPSLIRSLDELGPECADFLQSVELILHSGDISTRRVLDWCEQFAPVIAVRGNHDVFDDERLDEEQVLELEGWHVGMAHDLHRGGGVMSSDVADRVFGGAKLDLMLAGDTHVDRLEDSDGVVMLNSGRPNLPHHKETRLGTVALLDLEPERMRVEIVVLGHSDGAVNPGAARSLEVSR